VASFLERRGEGVHHLAYASDAIETDLQRAAGRGCRLINEVLPYFFAVIWQREENV